MAQHDYNIEDQNGFDFLVDLNNALSAIVTNNAGSSEPNTTFAHMLWFDTNNDLMKVRNEANSAWVIVAKKDGSGWTPYRQGTALGTASVQPDNRYAHRSNNLSDLGSAATARANLGVDAPGAAPLFACRAWVNFDGTGTVGIRASGNVSSITDNGTGDYTVNFTTDMEDADYSLLGTAANAANVNNAVLVPHTLSASSVRVLTKSLNGISDDRDTISAGVIR
jgi:hypothetical protein